MTKNPAQVALKNDARTVSRSAPSRSFGSASPKKSSAPAVRQRAKTTRRGPKFVVRNSPIHGRGVYAARPIRAGERIVEYTGELISWKEADRRPPSDPDDPHHTFLFSLDDGKRVIDAGVGGNSARWINHSCDPNCETEETKSGHVYIEALRNIRPGEELHYDYCLVIDGKITKKLKRQYRCLCGAPKCRGTMLAKKKKKKKKR